MSDLERRFTPWLELVTELLSSPASGEIPHAVIGAALIATFGCRVSWNWRDADGRSGFDLKPDHLDAAAHALMAECHAHIGLDHHPLLRWFAHTGDSTAMSAGRVPVSVASPECAGLLRDLMSPYDCEEQLSIPVRIDGPVHHAFVLARPDEDFSDEDVALARRIQPLLQLVDRQCQVFEERVRCAGSLTGRELATLHLLSEGLTATAIGHRLGVSPRTVHKHLENLYRKLGVRDRLQAVLVAREAGIPRQRGPHRERVSTAG